MLSLYKRSPKLAAHFMGADSLVAYWKRVMAHPPGLFSSHPARQPVETFGGACHCPISFFEDDIQTFRKNNLRALQWDSYQTCLSSTAVRKVPV